MRCTTGGTGTVYFLLTFVYWIICRDKDLCCVSMWKRICSNCFVNVSIAGNGLQVIIGVSVLRFVLEDAGIIF